MPATAPLEPLARNGLQERLGGVVGVLRPDGGGGGALCGAPVASYAVSLSLGIVGLPNVGKSTLFNALTKNDVLAANYPFATIEPNIGVVGVPDERLP